MLWEAADRICGKRLKAGLPLLIAAMERREHIALDGEVRQRLLQMSAATFDRVLERTRDEGWARADAGAESTARCARESRSAPIQRAHSRSQSGPYVQRQPGHDVALTHNFCYSSRAVASYILLPVETDDGNNVWGDD